MHSGMFRITDSSVQSKWGMRTPHWTELTVLGVLSNSQFWTNREVNQFIPFCDCSAVVSTYLSAIHLLITTAFTNSTHSHPLQVKVTGLRTYLSLADLLGNSSYHSTFC